MVTRRPLVVQDGFIAELPVGDTVTAGTSTTEVVAGSGLVGGGPVSNSPRLDLALAPNPSGIIYVGDALGIDGAAGVTADIALASGSAAAVLASNALASGNNSLVVGTAALASGNAALELVPTLGGGGGGTVAEFTAASAIVSGYAVGVDDTGRVQSVRGSSSENSNPMLYTGSTAVFETGLTKDIASTYDSVNNKVIIAYQDNGNSRYGTAVVGTVSGNSISFGTPVVFQSSAINDGYSTGIAYDPVNSAFVVAYTDETDGFKAKAKVGVVSGTTISFGLAYTLNVNTCIWVDACYDSFNGSIAIVYGDQGNQEAVCRVVQISGTTLTIGTPATYIGGGFTYYNNVSYDSVNKKIVAVARNDSASNYGYASVGTISDTSVSFGSVFTFNSATTAWIRIEYDPDTNRHVIIYRDFSLNQTRAKLGTVSGTSISFSSSFLINSQPTEYTPGAVYDPLAKKMVVSFEDLSNSYYPTTVALTVTSTTITVGTKAVVNSASTGSNDVTYNSAANRCVVSFRDFGNSSQGTARVAEPLLSASYGPTINSYPNVLGISQSTVASGSTCLVNLPGTLYNEPAANLTTGAFYYANPTTSGITTTSTKPTLWNGQVPWNYIGRAVTSSGLMLLKSI